MPSLHHVFCLLKALAVFQWQYYMQDLGRELTREEREVEEELQDAERYLEGIERQYKLPPFIEAPVQFFRSLKLPFLKLGS